MSSYRIVFSKQDLGYRISTLYRQKQFSIGILDFGTKEDLVSALDWYLANMNLSVHVLSTEFKMEQYDITKDYPEVTFIVFKNDTTTGEFINAKIIDSGEHDLYAQIWKWSPLMESRF